jgi:hypothetical protein
MKKTSLLVALPAVALTALLLSGCGLFRSHKAWDTAQQEAPLEIPPGLDRPSTSAALVIPPRGANQPTANGATAGVAAPDGQIADAFVVTDTLDNTYQRVGAALKDGSVGQVTAHDDASHSYTLSVTGASGKKKGLFHRVFGFMKRDNDGSPAAAHPVQVSIAASGASASEVRAQGDAAAVVKVMDALRSRVGS